MRRQTTSALSALLLHGLAPRQERTWTPCLSAVWVARMSHSKAAVGTRCSPCPALCCAPPLIPGPPLHPSHHTDTPCPPTQPSYAEESGRECAGNRRECLAALHSAKATKPAVWGWQELVAQCAAWKPRTGPVWAPVGGLGRVHFPGGEHTLRTLECLWGCVLLGQLIQQLAVGWVRAGRGDGTSSLRSHMAPSTLPCGSEQQASGASRCWWVSLSLPLPPHLVTGLISIT